MILKRVILTGSILFLLICSLASTITAKDINNVVSQNDNIWSVLNGKWTTYEGDTDITINGRTHEIEYIDVQHYGSEISGITAITGTIELIREGDWFLFKVTGVKLELSPDGETIKEQDNNYTAKLARIPIPFSDADYIMISTQTILNKVKE